MNHATRTAPSDSLDASDPGLPTVEVASMTELGVSLIGEEHPADDLVDTAIRAEEAGFSFAMASDHVHPWTSTQGNAPFVWSTLGAIARETDSLTVGTGVTCPLYHIHPLNVAQAAATVATMMPGRFFLGVGTGENLNEHVLGDRWPPHDVRLERLEEAVEVIRLLWSGETVSHHGEHFTVENARLYTVPDEPIPLHVGASGSQAAAVAGRIGDGLINVAPTESTVERFRSGEREVNDDQPDGGGRWRDERSDPTAGERPTYGQVTVCWAETEQEGRETAHEQWPNTGLPGELNQVLPTPAHFEQATEMLDEEDVVEHIVCGSDPDEHIEMIERYADAGYENVSVHQIGAEQASMVEFYAEEVLPSFA
jgi:G6PDH family F420-dependent oxidoreductase